MVRVPFVDLQAEYAEIRDEIEPVLHALLARGQFILGPHVERFEDAFAAYTGGRYCVAVSDGTEALKLTLESLGIGRGDEVIVPAHTFAATALAVWAAGATPRLVDCELDSHLIDVEAVKRVVGANTRAILPVHLYGRVVDVEPLLALGLPVIEDAAQAHGAMRAGRHAGTFGIAGCFSFYPSKNLGAYGDGGAVVTADEGLRQRLLRLRNYGQSQKYHHDEKGYNARLDALQAAVLEIKLRHLDDWNDRRRRAAAYYGAHLRPELPHPDWQGVFHLYPIRVGNRDALRAALGAAGIETGIHYPIPLHLLGCFRELGHTAGDFPNAERIARETLSLPMYPQLGREALAYVVAEVNRQAEPP